MAHLITAEYHMGEHPTNPVKNTRYKTATGKTWADDVHPITNQLVVHTYAEADGRTNAIFEPYMEPMYDDDPHRGREYATAPNYRKWRFEYEADIENWFHTEVSNVVLSAWARYPSILQTSHNKPLSAEPISQNVDATYSARINGARVPVIIGEFKRNIIKTTVWQSGNVKGEGQKALSRELRGYARKYHCPQIFCFDGETLLLLQFRAAKVEDIESTNCAIDCWVFPRRTTMIPLRQILYRFLAQGWRRCQGMSVPGALTLGGLTQSGRAFFNGVPYWRVNGVDTYEHPEGYQRGVHHPTGAVVWNHPDYPDPEYSTPETNEFWGLDGSATPDEIQE